MLNFSSLSKTNLKIFYYKRLAPLRCVEVFAACLGVKEKGIFAQCQAFIRRSKLVKIKQFCAVFKATREFTNLDCRTAIYF